MVVLVLFRVRSQWYRIHAIAKRHKKKAKSKKAEWRQQKRKRVENLREERQKADRGQKAAADSRERSAYRI